MKFPMKFRRELYDEILPLNFIDGILKLVKFYRRNFASPQNFKVREILKRVKFQSLQNFEVCEIRKSRSNF